MMGEASKGYKKKIPEIERPKIIDKYAQMKRFNYGSQIQVYMYAFMYAYTETIPEED